MEGPLSNAILSHKLAEQSMELLDQQGRLLSRFNLASYGIPEKLSRELLRAMMSEFGHTSLETHRQTFRCIRKLARFLKETNEEIELPLRSTTPNDFHQWLASSELCASTAQSHQNVVFAILKWCQRNSRGVISARAVFPFQNFQRNQPKSRKPLIEDTVRKILSACYEEIEEVETQRDLGDRLFRGMPQGSNEEELAKLLSDVFRAGNGRIPGQTALNRAGGNLARRVAAAGGLSFLRELIYVSPRAMFPFYLAIMCQTAGNPSPISKIQCECIEGHPIREDIEVLIWFKPRSQSEQRAEFPRTKQWSAPSIVRRFLRVSGYTREHLAKGADRSNLFIATPRRGALTGRVPCAQQMHLMLEDFILKHGIENFDFKDLRLFSANTFKKTSGGLLAAKQKLNHRSLRTTEKYINPTEVAPQYDKFIHHFQGKLVSLAKDGSIRSAKDKLQEKAESETSASTVFGFDCSAPFSGVYGRSKRGELCTDFTGCATCAGAIIPTDDPGIISRLVSAKLALSSAKDRSIREGWVARFNSVYLPTLVILENDVLPSVSASVLAKATEIAKSSNILFLE